MFASAHGFQRFRVTALLIGCLSFVPRVAAQPAENDDASRRFQRSSAFVLEVDGVQAPDARFYLSERKDAYLISSSLLPDPVLLSLRTKDVSTVPASAVVSDGDGVVLPASAERTSRGAFELEGGVPAFSIDGRRISISYPPSLLGLQDVAALHEHSPHYAERAAAYEPDEDGLERLRSLQTTIRLRVYFGSWCSQCRRQLPHLIKVIESLEDVPIEVEYYGLPRDREADPEPARMGLESLPTAVVYRDGKEVGRLIGPQWEAPETALGEILTAEP